MVMMERFGSPASRIISVMKSFQIPARSVQPGDKLLVITDDAMDPLIWQCMMAAINEKGGEAGGEISVGLNKLCQKDNDSVREWKKHYGAMHFGVGHGADRGKVNSILRLEGITDKITMTIDDTVVCEKGQFKI